MREPLDVWLYGTRLAQLEERADERLHLRWSTEAEERWGRGARLLSAALTVGVDPPPTRVRAYLEGLLPEGNARVNAALTAGVPVEDTYALIRTYGRDTPGAAIFLPAGSSDPTRQGRYVPLTRADVAERLRQADAHQRSSPSETSESSTLPGMVPKITLHRDAEGGWFACKNGAPSTWILKRATPIGSGVSDVVDTEAACLDLARRVGLTTISADVLDFGDVRAIAVSRYDRGPDLERVHQEDLAQAIGLNTQDPNRKFQWGSRIPSLSQAADILRLDGGNPDTLLRLVTFSHLVGNTDMHAKNISFLRREDGRVELSPAYDIAMHLHHQGENRRSALDIDGRFRMAEITIADVVAEAVTWGVPTSRARRVVADTSRDLQAALESIDRRAHPGVPLRAWEIVDERTSEAVKVLTVSRPPRATSSGKPPPTERPASPRRRGPRRPR